MGDMKCPFCQQELDCMGKYTDGSSKWLCNKCGLFGDKKLFDEIIRTRKALETMQVFVTKLYLSGKITDEQLVRYKKMLISALEQK